MRIDETVAKYINETKIELYPMASAKYAGKVAIRKNDQIYDPLMKSWVSMKALVHMDDWKGLALEPGAAKKLLQGGIK